MTTTSIVFIPVLTAGDQDVDPGCYSVPPLLGSQVYYYQIIICQDIITVVLRFIMETLLKMGILQFTTTVYWIR